MTLFLVVKKALIIHGVKGHKKYTNITIVDSQTLMRGKDLEFLAHTSHKWFESCPEKRSLSLIGTGVRFLKNKLIISFCEPLNCNTNGNPRLTSDLLVKWGHWLERSIILKVGMERCGEDPHEARDIWAPTFWWVFASRISLSTPNTNSCTTPIWD